MSGPGSQDKLLESYILNMISRNSFTPYQSLEAACLQFNLDAAAMAALSETHYFNGCDHHVPKSGNIHLAWEYTQDPRDYSRFLNMLRIPPLSFNVLLELIKNHPVFYNQSQSAQAPVETQLAVTLYQMGRYGNGASVQEVARVAGISEGSVDNYTDRCLTAIESLHDIYIRPLTAGEKEVEKMWLENQLGFRGLWRDG
ncbi:hypothetical protein H0H81_002401 [Sphagnurus paluster]|uniref:Uncharacterized protein n=1 Tax=Sphagnurus paluster TaxID=117069 RepID=A0A9P7KHG2_9AGAR|nr:hypothetical protein H0H81_002401 [Sphagnurus paluster]